MNNDALDTFGDLEMRELKKKYIDDGEIECEVETDSKRETQFMQPRSNRKRTIGEYASSVRDFENKCFLL